MLVSRRWKRRADAARGSAVIAPGCVKGIAHCCGTGVLKPFRIAWRHLPLELGFGSGSTCYRRLCEWQEAGMWERLHALLLAELRAAGEIEWSRAVADSSHLQAKKGAPRRARARLIEPEAAPSITSWSTRPGSRSRGRLRAATATTSPS